MKVKKAPPALTLLQNAVLALVLTEPRMGGGGAVGLLGHSKAGRESSGKIIHGNTVKFRSGYEILNDTKYTF